MTNIVLTEVVAGLSDKRISHAKWKSFSLESHNTNELHE